MHTEKPDELSSPDLLRPAYHLLFRPPIFRESNAPPCRLGLLCGTVHHYMGTTMRKTTVSSRSPNTRNYKSSRSGLIDLGAWQFHSAPGKPRLWGKSWAGTTKVHLDFGYWS